MTVASRLHQFQARLPKAHKTPDLGPRANNEKSPPQRALDSGAGEAIRTPDLLITSPQWGTLAEFGGGCSGPAQWLRDKVLRRLELD